MCITCKLLNNFLFTELLYERNTCICAVGLILASYCVCFVMVLLYHFCDITYKYINETSSSGMRRGDWLPWPGEAQKRDERRAEARLAEGLQRLDQAKHYHINTLTREQRKIHRDLISIKTGT